MFFKLSFFKMTMFNGTSMFQSLSMIKKNIIPVNGVKVTIV